MTETEESAAEVGYVTLEWVRVDWFNHRRLLEPIGNVPPAELLELAYDGQHCELAIADYSNQ